MIALAITAAAALAVAGLCVGLYLGERGRRIAAENMKLYGTPQAGPAHRAGEKGPMRPMPAITVASAEVETQPTIEFSEETIERGTETLIEQYREAGVELPREVVREHAKAMLAGDDGFGSLVTG